MSIFKTPESVAPIGKSTFYVSKRYGNDSTGNGTKENPFASPFAPILNGANDGDYVVIDSALYSDTMPTGSPYLNYIGEGVVFFSSETESEPFFTNFNSIDNIRFGIKSSGEAINSTAFDASVLNCSFKYCDVSGLDNRNTFFFKCLFDNARFVGNGYNSKQVINCTFINSSGNVYSLSTSRNSGQSFVNNFISGGSLQLFSSNEQPVGVIFDYNCFSLNTTLDGLTLDQIKTSLPWSNQNSITEENPFIDFDASRSYIDSWKNSYILDPVSDCANGGAGQSFEKYIGFKPSGYVFTAQDILNEAVSTTNIEIVNNDFLRRNDDTLSGNITTGSIAINGGSVEVINMVSMNQLISYALDGLISSVATKTGYDVIDNQVNQKATVSFQIGIGNTLNECNNAPFKTFEENYDFVVDSQGLATSDAGFDLSSTMQLVSFSHFKLNIDIVNL